MDMELLAQAVLLSFLLMQFINALIKPIVEIINASAEGQPIKALVIKLWPLYLSLIIAGSISWFADLDLLAGMLPAPMGRILTSIAIGLGPSFIYDLLDKPEPREEVVVSILPKTEEESDASGEVASVNVGISKRTEDT